MNKNYIKNQVAELVQKYNTRDPAQIADSLGISIKWADIGTLKGMYTVLLGSPFIVVNNALSEPDSRQIIAHELGHDRLHRHFAEEGVLQETMLYDMTSQPEYEANVFAAHLLMDPQCQEWIREGETLSEIAARCGVDKRLAEIYFQQG